MATFYVLASRHLAGQRFGEMLTAMFPEMQPTPWEWPDLAAMLVKIVEGQGSAYVVFREELDDRVSIKDALLRDFGAALDDDIMEVHFGAGLHQVLHQSWSKDGAKRVA